MTRAVLVAALLLLPVVARAGAPDESPPKEDETTQAAEVHYNAAEQYYLRGQYPEAIKEFMEAYRLSKRPELLYNISQSYERNGDLRNARTYLQQYLDSGVATEDEKPVLRDKLASFDERIKAEDKQKAEEAKREHREPRARPFKIWRWIATGAGIGFAGASVFFTIDSGIQSDKVQNAAGMGKEFDKSLQDAEARGKQDETLAIVTGAVGVAALGVGVLFIVLDHSAVRENAQIVPMVTPTGGGAAILWQW